MGLLRRLLPFVHRKIFEMQKTYGLISPETTLASADERYGHWKHSWKLFFNEHVQILNGTFRKSEFLNEMMLFKFDREDIVRQWMAVSDAVIGGKSNCTLSFNKSRKLMLTGETNATVPHDGVTFVSGYCGMKTLEFKASFNRKAMMDLSSFDVLEIRLRGDGRTYSLNLLMDMSQAEMWEDQFNYFIYTRGGPYWQTVQIPFSRFFMTGRGRIQRYQGPPALTRVRGLGFTLSDSVEGPFTLEVDYIKVKKDSNHNEEFAYETPGTMR